MSLAPALKKLTACGPVWLVPTLGAVWAVYLSTRSSNDACGAVTMGRCGAAWARVVHLIGPSLN